MRRQQFSWSGFHDHGQVVMESLAPSLYSAVATQGVNGSVQKHTTTKAMEQLVLSLARKWASQRQLGQILLSSGGRVVVKLRDGKIISWLQNLLWGNAQACTLGKQLSPFLRGSGMFPHERRGMLLSNMSHTSRTLLLTCNQSRFNFFTNFFL